MTGSEGGYKHGFFQRIWNAVIEIYIYLLDFFFPTECSSRAKLPNTTVVITGGNTGLGKETALDLAARGAKVIIGCRDVEKGRRAAQDIRKQVEKSKVIVKQLDLASFASIRQFAAEILKTEPRIHLLINNAGVMACPKSNTEEGFETHFGVNHLGHFLLTNLLLDRIKASAPARIINVTSAMYFCGKIPFDDINMHQGYNRVLAYSNSKLAKILFTRELAKRLEGTGVTTYFVHPGIVETELSRHLKGTIAFLRDILRKLIFKTPKQGAQTTIYCAVDEELAHKSGLYYSGCMSIEPLLRATDDVTAEKLWTLSERLTNVDKFLSNGIVS